VIFLIEHCEVVIKEEGEKRPVESDCESDTEEAEEELVLEHPGQLCRLCASAVSEAVYIFGATGKEQRIAEKINSCLPVMVSCLRCNSVVLQNSRFVVLYVGISFFVYTSVYCCCQGVMLFYLHVVRCLFV